MVTGVVRDPFTADAPGSQDAATYRQFERLELYLGEMELRVEAMEADLSAIMAIVGDGTWDGGTP